MNAFLAIDPADSESAVLKEVGAFRLGYAFHKSQILRKFSENTPVSEEQFDADWAAFCRAYKVDPASGTPVPKEFRGCPPESLRSVVEQETRIAEWKKKTFEPQARSHFDARKSSLDRVVYSMLRVQDPGVARELWFRISEKEATFADLAPQYSTGDAAFTAGFVGPIAYGALHPKVAEILKSNPIGRVIPPLPMGEWQLLLRKEHTLSAEFTDSVKAQMIEELTEVWLEEQCHV